MNRLAAETSPYLLQHRHNPVDWYPWGEEALARAKAEDKVIFLSIGYAACHWCHVMERESFENEEIAARLNEHFVCIKVDREERPDLDEIYMASVQAMTGRGGWPMTVFMTPELRPFYAGTYFPPEDRHGMPGFPRVVEHVRKLWSERREEVREQAGRVADYLRDSLAPVTDAGDPSPELVAAACAASAQRYDEAHGGFAAPPGYAPKFPHAAELTMLLRHAVRAGDDRSREIATHTLRAMAEGGIYDHLGGGFHRYSTDRVWLVPHFEKMLYDNAQLARTYAEAHRATGEPLFRRVVVETLDYLLREMQHEQGGFFSTQDADSEGVEGKFFVWSKAEVDAALGADAEAFCLRYGISADGNWEGSNVLHAARPLADVAARLELDEPELARRLAAARAELLASRARRVRPGTDDKVLAAWNGLAIGALAVGHQLTGDGRYLAAAQRAAAFVLDHMRRDGRLLRSWRDGDLRHTGYLEDYAFVADGLLSLFESDFDPRWLREADALLGAARDHFRADDGSFFFTADDHEQLVARSKSVQESSQPSGVAMVAQAALRLGLLRGDGETWELGFGALRANHAYLAEYGIACPSLVLAADFALADPVEIVICGERGDPRTAELLAAARAKYPPYTVVVLVDDAGRAGLEAATPIVAGKTPVDGVPAAYVCRRGVCEAPVTKL